MSRPAWVQDPRYDLPVGEDGLPAEWNFWTAQEQEDYADARVMDAPPGYDPPRIPATPVTD